MTDETAVADPGEVERLLAELARERDRARDAAADARRAERQVLESARQLRATQADLKAARATLRTLRGRPLQRIADFPGRCRRALVRRLGPRVRLLRRNVAQPTTSPSDAVVEAITARASDARDSPGRYREAMRAMLAARPGARPLRVAVVGRAGEAMGHRDDAAVVATALTACAIEATTVPASAIPSIGRDTDVVISVDGSHDLGAIAPGIVRVAWMARSGDLDPTRTEADLVVAAPFDDGPAFVAALEGWISAMRVAIRTPSTAGARAANWGDTHFARDLRAALRRAGSPARIHFRGSWDHAAVGADDVVIDLLGAHEPSPPVGACRMLWQISHPELASPEVYERYDAVFVASDRFAELMAADVAVPVRPLHQATDPGRFHPQPGPAHEVLVVANWRADRRLIADLLPTDRRVAVYGRGWTIEHAGPGVVIGGPIANDELPRYYAGAAILLNDHAAGMRREGFMSNRLYDGAASGTLVVTDAVDGVGPEFDGGVLVYRDREQLRSIVARYLADPTLRAATSWKARQAVLARHTFDHRVRVLLDAARPILAARVARDSP